MTLDRTLTPWLDQDLADIPGETWRTVPAHAAYQVSSYGRVKAAACERKPARICRQYLGGSAVTVWLGNLGTPPGGRLSAKPQLATVKHLVVEAFELEKPVAHIWTHVSTNKQDNRVGNIISLSRLELMKRRHARRLRTLSEQLLGRAGQLSRLARWERANGVFHNGVLVALACKACGRQRPLSEYRALPTGPRPTSCRDCQTKRRQPPPPPCLPEGSTRRCTKCERTLPLDAAHFRPSKAAGHLGFGYWCQTCTLPRPPKPRPVLDPAFSSLPLRRFFA